MAYALSPELDRIVREKLSTGNYATEEEVLRKALRLLNDYESAVSGIVEGYADLQAGRHRSFDKADADFREKHGINEVE